jgi:hypothetical protein
MLIQDLDKHFESQKKIQNILMDISFDIHTDLVEELKEFEESLKVQDYESAQLILETTLKDSFLEKGVRIANKYIRIHIDKTENKKSSLGSHANVE